MLTTDEVQQLIDTGRTLTCDWVAGDASLEMLAEMIVALANSSGGTLMVGIDADGTIIGTPDKVTAADRMIEAALATEPPLITPLPQILEFDDKSVLVMQIPSGMPHIYAYDGRYLRREGTRNQALKPMQLRHLMIDRGAMSFEENPADGATLDDINWQKARDYARQLSGWSENDVRQVLIKRGCLTQVGSDFVPTNAGILLFGKDPQRFFISSDISAVRFAGESMGDTFSRQDIGGTLPDQIRAAQTFLFDNLRKAVQLSDQMQRNERYEYPLEAARELLVNAVAHRDYSIRGDNTRLFIFNNRMEVHSPGGLPGHMTINNLKDERFSRNPVIVQVLADMNFIEKLGYGLDRVIELLRSQNMSAPEFQEGAGGFRVILRRSVVQLPKPPIKQQSPVVDATASTPALPDLIYNGIYAGKEVNRRQEIAIITLERSRLRRITNGDLQQMFPDVHAETIRRDLSDLVTKDILAKMGQKRGSYYVLKGSEPVDSETSS